MGWGLYANLLAQLISQISSHVIIYYHHKIVQETLYTLMYNVVDQSCKKDSPQVMNKTCKETFIDENLNIEGGEIEVSETFNDENLNSEEGEIEVSLFESGGFPERLKDHSFSLNGTEKDRYVRVCKQINILFAVLFLSIFCFFILGSVLSSFHVEFLGIVGILIEIGQRFNQASYPHSLFSIASLIIEQAKFLQVPRYYIGLGILATVFVFTSFIMPLVQLMLVTTLWFAKLSEKKHKNLYLFIEIFQSWQY